MKNIFIIDEHISSQRNGVGTFMKLFVKCLQQINCKIYFISFNENVDDLKITRQNKFYLCQIPILHYGKFMTLGPLIFPLLSRYIIDQSNNIFIVNHSPCFDFLKCIRKNFPLSKILFIIHDQGWTSPLLGNINKLRKILYSSSIKNEDNGIKKYLKAFCKEEFNMYRISDAIVCLSTPTYQILQDIYKVRKEKLYLIPNALDLDFKIALPKERIHAKKELGFDERDFIFLYVGRIGKAKGIFELLLAFETLCEKYHQVRLVIVGNIENYSDLVRNHNKIMSRVTFTGLLKSEDLDLWYQAADIGILPSYTEQSSFTGLEMMARIGIVISTNGWGLTDMFHNDFNAIIAEIPYNDDRMQDLFTKNIEDAMIYALMKKNEKNYIQNCTSILNEKYSFDRFCSDYKKLFDNL